jgi:hypothetical protein
VKYSRVFLSGIGGGRFAATVIPTANRVVRLAAGDYDGDSLLDVA